MNAPARQQPKALAAHGLWGLGPWVLAQAGAAELAVLATLKCATAFAAFRSYGRDER
jgi:hypothetical protein